MTETIETDRIYVAEAQALDKRLSDWERLFIAALAKRLEEDTPLSFGQRRKLQQILARRAP